MPRVTSGGLHGNDRYTDERRATETREPLVIDQADIDPKLGTLSWTRFAAILHAEKFTAGSDALLVVDLDRSSRSNVIMSDINKNEILPLLADALRRCIRSDDIITHLGACRFALLLRGAPEEVAETVAKRIHQSVADTVFLVDEGLVVLSVDVGGARYEKDRALSSEVMQAAMANLEAASSAATHTRLT